MPVTPSEDSIPPLPPRPDRLPRGLPPKPSDALAISATHALDALTELLKLQADELRSKLVQRAAGAAVADEQVKRFYQSAEQAEETGKGYTEGVIYD